MLCPPLVAYSLADFPLISAFIFDMKLIKIFFASNLNNLFFTLVNLQSSPVPPYSACLRQISVCCPGLSQQTLPVEVNFNIRINSYNSYWRDINWVLSCLEWQFKFVCIKQQEFTPPKGLSRSEEALVYLWYRQKGKWDYINEIIFLRWLHALVDCPPSDDFFMWDKNISRGIFSWTCLNFSGQQNFFIFSSLLLQTTKSFTFFSSMWKM